MEGGPLPVRPPPGTIQTMRGAPARDLDYYDPDFAEEILADLYTYRPKRLWLAWLLWGLLGLMGGHRFYLGRHGTGILMLLTVGGAGLWWLVDAFLLTPAVREHNREQNRREAAGEPPIGLEFMPPLSREVLERPPAWARRWKEKGPGGQALRLLGDAAVLLVVGAALGAVAREAGVWEAILAVVALAALTSAGAAAGGWIHLPLVRDLVRWGHRVRLFYYRNRPGTPPALLVRPLTGAVLAPFRRLDRAEARLYVELGGVFTLAFLLLDLVEAVIAEGLAALSIGGLTSLWAEEAVVTFLVIYCFATPVGAVLTFNLLTRSTHLVPRLLAALTLVAIGVGVLV